MKASRGEFEPQPQSFSEHLVLQELFSRSGRPGTMIDVGAFDGRSFEPFLELGWEVYAFEPDPSHHRKIQETYDSPRLHLYNCAISDEPRQDAPFYISEEASSVSSLRPFLDSHREFVRVEVKSLREIIAEEGIDRLDYLKIDAEGFDLQVLRGFPWDEVRPTVVLCEFEDFKTRPLGYGTHDLGEFLLARGYRVFLSEWDPIVKYGGQHRWRQIHRYPCELRNSEAWGNLIAATPEISGVMFDAILKTILTDRQKQISSLAERDESLERTREALKERNQMIGELRTSISDKNETIHFLKIKIARALQEPKDALDRIRQDLQERNEMIRELRNAIARRDELIDRLKSEREVTGGLNPSKGRRVRKLAAGVESGGAEDINQAGRPDPPEKG